MSFRQFEMSAYARKFYRDQGGDIYLLPPPHRADRIRRWVSPSVYTPRGMDAPTKPDGERSPSPRSTALPLFLSATARRVRRSNCEIHPYLPERRLNTARAVIINILFLRLHISRVARTISTKTVTAAGLFPVSMRARGCALFVRYNVLYAKRRL